MLLTLFASDVAKYSRLLLSVVNSFARPTNDVNAFFIYFYFFGFQKRMDSRSEWT